MATGGLPYLIRKGQPKPDPARRHSFWSGFGGLVSKRQALSNTLRFEIFKRDGFSCQYCGRTPPAVTLEIDHIHPVSKGGDNLHENLITACFDCNRGKSKRLLKVAPPSLAEQAALIAERQAQLKGYEKIFAAAKRKLERDTWRVAQPFAERFSSDGSISRPYFRSISNFVKQLGVSQCMDAMELALEHPYWESRCFRYFCGICWKKIKGLNAESPA